MILAIFVSCSEEDSNDPPAGELVEGIYYQAGDNYVHLKVVNSGNSIYVYVVASQPNSYCEYKNRGELTSSSSSGLEVEGKWFQFYSSDTYCNDYSYTVVQQKDKNTIIVRRFSYDYEYAYTYGSSLTYKK